MSSWRQAVGTQCVPTVQQQDVARPVERHTHTKCSYVKRPKWKYVRGKNVRVYYWIRICQCGNQIDRSNMLDAHADTLNKTAGVEAHLREDCKWVQPKMGRFFLFKLMNKLLDSTSD